MNPLNTAPKQVPTPGGLAQVTVSYTPLVGPAQSKQFNAATFGMSCYNTALQADWGDVSTTCGSVKYNHQVFDGLQTLTPPAGHTPQYLSGTFCKAFLRSTQDAGSGLLTDGRTIQWAGAGNFVLVPILTKDSTVPVAGRTLARDRTIIPGKGVQVALDGLGSNLLADDTGSPNYIAGYRFDLFGGIGNNACAGSPAHNNPILIGACSPGLAACPSSDLQ